MLVPVLVPVPRGDGRSHLTLVPLPRSWKDAQGHVDFVLERNESGELVSAISAFQALQVSLGYEYFADNVVVWENGAQRVRKQYTTVELAASQLFWERDIRRP